LAKARGVKTLLIEYVFVLLATLIVVSSLKLIGALLVLALVVVPVASAGNFRQ
jgi:zinc transport system permease protein